MGCSFSKCICCLCTDSMYTLQLLSVTTISCIETLLPGPCSETTSSGIFDAVQGKVLVCGSQSVHFTTTLALVSFLHLAGFKGLYMQPLLQTNTAAMLVSKIPLLNGLKHSLLPALLMSESLDSSLHSCMPEKSACSTISIVGV